MTTLTICILVQAVCFAMYVVVTTPKVERLLAERRQRKEAERRERKEAQRKNRTVNGQGN